MPETQPSKEAMANNLAIRWHDDPGYGCVAACTAEYCPIVKEITGELAAALEAYAAEHSKAPSDIAAGLVERCHKLEVESARWKAQFESTNAAGIGVVEKLAIVEERIEEALTMFKSHPKTAALLLRDALGRSKVARRDSERGSSAFVSNQRAVPPCGEDA